MSEMMRGELLQHLREDYGGLRQLLERQSENEVSTPGLVGDWSAQQLLAHIVAWEEEGLERLRLIGAGRRDEIRGIRSEEVNAWNAAAVARLAEVPWRKLLARWLDTRVALVEAVTSLTDEQLDPPGGRFRVSKWMPNFTWAHEAEHAADVSSDK